MGATLQIVKHHFLFLFLFLFHKTDPDRRKTTITIVEVDTELTSMAPNLASNMTRRSCRIYLLSLFSYESLLLHTYPGSVFNISIYCRPSLLSSILSRHHMSASLLEYSSVSTDEA
jgi:hypothetical protein